MVGAPGVPGGGGSPVSIPRGSDGKRMSLARSGGGATPGAGPVGATGGGTVRSVPPVPMVRIPGSTVGLVATVVPATGDMASAEWPARSVRATRTDRLPAAATLNWADPSASGRVGTGVQVAPSVAYSSLNFDQSGLRSVTFHETVTSSPTRWAPVTVTTGFLVSKRTFRAGWALKTSAGKRTPALLTTTMLNQYTPSAGALNVNWVSRSGTATAYCCQVCPRSEDT